MSQLRLHPLVACCPPAFRRAALGARLPAALVLAALLARLGGAGPSPALAQFPGSSGTDASAASAGNAGDGSGDNQPGLAGKPINERPFPDPPGKVVRLAKDQPIWIDTARKIVIVDGRVCLREGTLEMFACPTGTKEHESIVAVEGRPQVIHAGLLAVGAKSGKPVQFDPKYTPPSGDEIEIMLLWRSAKGERKMADARSWVKHIKSGKQLEFPWVFAGSGFYVDQETKQKYYHGDGGDFICVSNFPTATLDLPIPSSQSNDDLLFSPFTERIPPIGTRVRMVLRPKSAKPAAGAGAAAGADASGEIKAVQPPGTPAPGPDSGTAAPQP